jgi:hypothetical protein
MSLWTALAAVTDTVPPAPKVLSISSSGLVRTSRGNVEVTLRSGEEANGWTLMAVVSEKGQPPLAVFEDFTQPKGHLLFVGRNGVTVDLPKSLEPTYADPASLYHGHTLKEVFSSERDLLAEEILARPGDPEYAQVAACFPPMAKMKTCFTFVGTPDNFEKVGILNGGWTPTFDPVAYVPAIEKNRKDGRFLDGLVGGWLPVVRFVYPEQPGDWTEFLAYAPMRLENDNNRVQPVWYRVARVEQNQLKWVRYFDSYHPFPPRLEQPGAPFYEQLLAMRANWEGRLKPAMTIQIPDQRLADLARHSLVRDMMTRIGSFPKYGVFDRSYGGSEHDGFPDTFTADTAAMLAWGLLELAGQYIDNYFTWFVRDDGSILYRGPETGQFGRMLTVVADYANYTGNSALLLKQRHRIDAVAKLLLALRQKALALPADDPAHGMIAGWSEADACLDPDPHRYMQPYFANSTEAERGFRELGGVWEKIGREKRRAELIEWGKQLQREGRALAADVQTSINRSVFRDLQPPCLPAIAGVRQPFHVAVVRDNLDPQFRSYRGYSEMLYSGSLSREQVEMVIRYRAAHHDTILGIPACYGHNTHELAGFLSYGHAFGLVQHGFDREYLLTLYSLMAHQYTRGTWTAPETRNLEPKLGPSPYCAPAQLVVPLLTRWMLVLEDPATRTLWLAKDTPRQWLEDGQSISVSNAPTQWGRVSYTVRSRLREGRIEAAIDLPGRLPPGEVKLRLRAPENHRMRSATINQAPWSQFDPEGETITLPAKSKGRIAVAVYYR